MVKKTISLVIILVLAGGGFFYWWQNQADVRELNKTLPEGVRVVKSLIKDEYRVVNKIDGYSFKVPQEWKGVEEVNYSPVITEQGYTASSFGIAGNEAAGRIAGIDRYKIEKDSMSLNSWAKDNFSTFGLVGDFSEEKVGGFEVVKTQENVHLGGMWVYFFEKDSIVYVIVCGSEEFIKEIILNGTW